MKILIIEDEVLLANSIKALLENKGFQVECVYDGEDGAMYAETGVYDLLILDVMMPKMNGYEVAKKVRADRCNTPILMLTAKSGIEDRLEAITNPLAEKRDGEKAFKVAALTNQEYKVFQQYHGEKTRVRIRFINRLADAVIDQFGKDTMLIPIDDKHFTATLPVELSPPFFAWVATFGRGAKILFPQLAIDEMRKFIERVSDMYKDEG